LKQIQNPTIQHVISSKAIRDGHEGLGQTSTEPFGKVASGFPYKFSASASSFHILILVSMIQHLLVAQDFSSSSSRALAYALDLAGRTGATLHLLHVEEVPLGPLVKGHPSPVSDENTLLEPFTERCRSLIDDETLDALDVRYHVRRAGAVAPALVEMAKETSVDLIVMGTQGQRGLRRAILGSAAREVLRTAPCPVLTTRALSDEEASGTPPVERIVVPIDFSDSSRRALQYTARLTGVYDVPVKLLHVVEAPSLPSVYEIESPKIATRKVKGRAERTLEAWGRDVLPGHHDVSYVVHRGAPAELILEAAPSPTDLLVMATRGLSGVRRTMLGSVTEAVVSGARAPVLSARSFPSA
jgi:nucleotide-binding universal stress UspA family protein